MSKIKKAIKRQAMTHTTKYIVKVPDFIAMRAYVALQVHVTITMKVRPTPIGWPYKSVAIAAIRTLSHIIIQKASIFCILEIILLHATDAIWRNECNEATAFMIPSWLLGCIFETWVLRIRESVCGENFCHSNFRILQFPTQSAYSHLLAFSPASAAAVSASCLEVPLPSAIWSPPMCTATVKALLWSGPVSFITL